MQKKKQKMSSTTDSSVIENCKERDVTIMIGDLNAKTGNENTGHDDVMRQHGLGQMNKNGENLLCIQQTS